MQGVLIASAHSDVKRSLVAILQEGRTIHDCRTVAECLTFAAAQRFDYIFVDDTFPDGKAEELVRRLHALGYGIEMVPILLASDPIHLKPFRTYGVRHFISKPFDVKAVQQVVDQIAEIADLQDIPLTFNDAATPEPTPPPASGPIEPDPRHEIDVREISQRFRRLLTRLSRREDLVQAFTDSLQEQFDVDNVCVLLPQERAPSFRLAAGNVTDEVREQFFMPFEDPLVAALVRLGEPVWVHDRDRLGRQNAIAAVRCGERLNVQLLCPVLSRGRLLALVGLSRVHRYENSPVFISLLRLFVTFFSEALENTGLYEKASAAGHTYRSMLQAIPFGLIYMSSEGRILHATPAAAAMLGLTDEDLLDQPIERAGSIIADLARESAATQQPVVAGTVRVGDNAIQASASPVAGDDGGAVIILKTPESRPPPTETAGLADSQALELWRNMSRTIAHNFKNAMVPVKTCAELLPERYDSKAFRQSFFEVVRENVTKIDTWIDALLAYAELRQDEREKQAVPLHACIDNAVQRVLAQCPENNIDISRDYGPLDEVDGNRQQLESLFAEILKNAVEAVQDVPQPRVIIRTTKTKGAVLATIEDNGPGMLDADKATAFEAFATRKLSGLGLGLAYSHRAVELHRGQMRINNAESGGTLIEVQLPAAQPEPVEHA